jgi:hypothetical protein
VVRQQALGLEPVSRGDSLCGAGTEASNFAGYRSIRDEMYKSGCSSRLRRRAYSIMHRATAMNAEPAGTGSKITPLSSTAFLDVMGFGHHEVAAQSQGPGRRRCLNTPGRFDRPDWVAMAVDRSPPNISVGKATHWSGGQGERHRCGAIRLGTVGKLKDRDNETKCKRYSDQPNQERQ